MSTVAYRGIILPLLLTSAFLHFSGVVFAEEEEVELPRGAERAIERYEREVADAREDLLESLDRELERATKRGELEVALAIKAKKEEFAGGETDFLGEPTTAANELPEHTAVIAYDGSRKPKKLVTGTPLFTNRGYSVTDVPSMFEGWSFVPTSGGHSHRQITVEVRKPGYVYALCNDASLGEGEQLEERTAYTDSGRTTLYIYRFPVRSRSWSTPGTSAFSGVILLIPPTGGE